MAKTRNAEMAGEESARRTGGTVEEKSFTVTLKLRHAQYVERLAKSRGDTVSRVIEWCVRQEWARDPYKAGAHAPSSSMPAVDGPKVPKG